MLMRNQLSGERPGPHQRPDLPAGFLALALSTQLTLATITHAETIVNTAERVIEHTVDNMRQAWEGFTSIELE